MIIPSRSAGASSASPLAPPGISYDTFLGVIWAGAALSLIFVLFRLYSRSRGPGRLFWDDAFVIFAEILVLTSAGLWQWAAKFMYYVLEAKSGLAAPGPNLIPAMWKFLDVTLAMDLFFYTILILVKLSFLFFFRRLGQNVQRQKYIWWFVLVFCLVVYVISLGDLEYSCYKGSLQVFQGYCISGSANDFTVASVTANTALDVISDFLIMIIPFTLLWNIQMRRGRKMAFIGLFSLSIIIMVVAVVRAVAIIGSTRGSGHEDATFLLLWSAVQASLAIMVSCLSAFPQLFSASAAKKKPVWTPTDTYYQRLRSRMKTDNRKKDTLYDLSAISLPGEPEPAPPFNKANLGLPESGCDTTRGATSNDSQSPVIKPSPSLQRQVVVCSGGIPDHDTIAPQGNQIRRQMEYRVTQHETPPYVQVPQYQWVQSGQGQGQ